MLFEEMQDFAFPAFPPSVACSGLRELNLLFPVCFAFCDLGKAQYWVPFRDRLHSRTSCRRAQYWVP